jgi:hypothetical protein
LYKMVKGFGKDETAEPPIARYVLLLVGSCCSVAHCTDYILFSSG